MRKLSDRDLHKVLQLFGHNSFRPGQKHAIHTFLGGQSLLAVMPTGSGKSLIYQCAGLVMPGVTLSISPLISLMKDQVDKLSQRGIPSTFINSTIPTSEQQERLERMVMGEYKLVYVAPERLRQFFFCKEIANVKIALLVVDEAHSISQGGHNFRPDYLQIAAFRKFVGNPVTAAFTATATPSVPSRTN